MVEIVVGPLAVGALGAVCYAVRWRRGQAKRAGVREKQLKKLKKIKRKFEEEK